VIAIRHSTRAVLPFCILTSAFRPPPRVSPTEPSPIESGCITNSARTHARKTASLNVCGACGLAPSIIWTTNTLSFETPLASTLLMQASINATRRPGANYLSASGSEYRRMFTVVSLLFSFCRRFFRQRLWPQWRPSAYCWRWLRMTMIPVRHRPFQSGSERRRGSRGERKKDEGRMQKSRRVLCQGNPISVQAFGGFARGATPGRSHPKPPQGHHKAIYSGVQSHPKATPRLPQGHPKATPRPPQGYPKATPRLPQGHPKATPRPPQGHPKATPRLPQGHPKATPRPPQGHPKATPRLPQGYPKATPRPPQGYLKATSRCG
jgi:hypothetical protein